ncbi:MAG TPA: hypothetical protein H9944_08880 [Candidatus Anaeromassilibacillus stercoravium]|nr:hypothetical protein [Candidatus Anaeromassilibacillus stercoravium]
MPREPMRPPLGARPDRPGALPHENGRMERKAWSIRRVGIWFLRENRRIPAEPVGFAGQKKQAG